MKPINAPENGIKSVKNDTRPDIVRIAAQDADVMIPRPVSRPLNPASMLVKFAETTTVNAIRIRNNQPISNVPRKGNVSFVSWSTK